MSEDLNFVGAVVEIHIIVGDVQGEGGKQPVVVFQARKTESVMGMPSVEEYGPLMAESLTVGALAMVARSRSAAESKPSPILMAKPGTRVN